jgi:ElaB/YqjD/DUF883 family membrane-anchored ribosome-binding protein
VEEQVMAVDAEVAAQVLTETKIFNGMKTKKPLTTRGLLLKRGETMNEQASKNMGRHNGSGRTQSADSLTSVATDAIKGNFDEVKNRYNDVREKALQYSDEVTHAVEQHPIYAVLGATAVGFILGALLTRK